MEKRNNLLHLGRVAERDADVDDLTENMIADAAHGQSEHELLAIIRRPAFGVKRKPNPVHTETTQNQGPCYLAFGFTHFPNGLKLPTASVRI